MTPFTRRRFLGTATASFSVLALAGCGGAEEADGTMSAMGRGGTKGKSTKVGADTTPPSAPQGLTASAGSASSITLNWGASTDNVGVTRYRLFRCQGSSCASGQQIASPTTTSYIDSTGLSPSTTYSYYVVAVDGAGNVSAPSSTATATTLAGVASDTTAPSVPTGVSATAGSSSSITVSWSASTDNVGVAGYILYRCDGSGCTQVAEIARTTALSYTNTDLAASTAYSYAVAAIDAAGNVSARSALVSATTLARNAPVAWQLDPPPVLFAGGSAFDLSKTLPSNVIRGGTFSLDASSAPLPSGVTLTATGLLSATASSTGSFEAVVFSYSEPS
jgi:chitodextrinase